MANWYFSSSHFVSWLFLGCLDTWSTWNRTDVPFYLLTDKTSTLCSEIRIWKTCKYFKNFICNNLLWVLVTFEFDIYICYNLWTIINVTTFIDNILHKSYASTFATATRYEALRVAFIHSEDVGVEGKKEFYSKLVKADIHGKDQVHNISVDACNG